MTTTRGRQWLLYLTAAIGAFVGVWALGFPQGWYDAFPGFGLSWIPQLGPFNEHLVRDVGALYLALTVLSLGAARRADDAYLVRLTGLSWFVFSLPHLVFHITHLDGYTLLDQVLNMITLSTFVVIGLILAMPAPRRVGSPSA